VLQSPHAASIATRRATSRRRGNEGASTTVRGARPRDGKALPACIAPRATARPIAGELRRHTATGRVHGLAGCLRRNIRWCSPTSRRLRSVSSSRTQAERREDAGRTGPSRLLRPVVLWPGHPAMAAHRCPCHTRSSRAPSRRGFDAGGPCAPVRHRATVSESRARPLASVRSARPCCYLAGLAGLTDVPRERRGAQLQTGDSGVSRPVWKFRRWVPTDALACSPEGLRGPCKSRRRLSSPTSSQEEHRFDWSSRYERPKGGRSNRSDRVLIGRGEARYKRLPKELEPDRLHQHGVMELRGIREIAKNRRRLCSGGFHYCFMPLVQQVPSRPERCLWSTSPGGDHALTWILDPKYSALPRKRSLTVFQPGSTP